MTYDTAYVKSMGEEADHGAFYPATVHDDYQNPRKRFRAHSRLALLAHAQTSPQAPRLMLAQITR